MTDYNCIQCGKPLSITPNKQTHHHIRGTELCYECDLAITFADPNKPEIDI
jgi:DNA-directed RNA polymerase subunit RPC12/RpoP